MNLCQDVTFNNDAKREIEFLNSIIVELQDKNSQLTQKMQLFNRWVKH